MGGGALVSFGYEINSNGSKGSREILGHLPGPKGVQESCRGTGDGGTGQERMGLS